MYIFSNIILKIECNVAMVISSIILGCVLKINLQNKVLLEHVVFSTL